MNQVSLQSTQALQSMISAGNVLTGGQGTSLWTINADVKFDILCTISITKNGTYHVIPIMDGVKNEDGSQANAIHFYAGTFYSEIETFEDGDKVLVSVVQRVPNKDITDADLERIDAWAKEQNEADGRVTSTRATDAFRLNRAKECVTYAVTSVSEL